VDKVLQAQDLNEIEVGIYPGYGKVAVSIFAKQKSKVECLKNVLMKAFPTHIFHSENGKLEEAIQHWMITNKKTLSLAESITGGKIAADLAVVAGASQYFLGSFVVYSNELKEKILEVSPKILNEYGAVSGETVKEMAQNLMSITGADYGIAISGIAGPTGGTKEKPIGTVWAALIEKGKAPLVWSFHFTGTRQKIIQGSVNRVLAALYRKIVYGISPLTR
jgi:nicotinamide-nucleotide amidase